MYSHQGYPYPHGTWVSVENGNNNAYCQDNETSWFDWSLIDKHADLHRFVRLLIRYRQGLPERADPMLPLAEVIERARVHWHGTQLDKPDWGDQSRSVAFTIETNHHWYHLIFNAYWEEITFALPSVPAGFHAWQRIVDTDMESPNDITGGTPLDDVSEYAVQGRSTVILASTLVGQSTTTSE